MEYRDRAMKCVDCGSEFIFTVGEQLFFADRGFKHEPKRCKPCKAKRSLLLTGQSYERTETSAVCSQCGKQTTVPFKPTQGRPVYCRECFQQRRTATASA